MANTTKGKSYHSPPARLPQPADLKPLQAAANPIRKAIQLAHARRMSGHA